MKFKDIISVILFVTAIFVSCNKVDSFDSLSSVKVSKSFLSISPTGGSEEITITSSMSWNISTELPAWLSASAISGSAGESKITFSASACDFGREAVLQIEVGVHSQFLTVRQGEMTISPATCKEVREGVEGKSYRVSGVCTSIANTSYGNWYMNDGTGELYIYGTVNDKGEYDWSSFDIEVGDVVTVEGPMSNYNGTIEIVDAAFISVTKSLLKITPESVSLKANGGDFTVRAAYKGSGAFIDIPDENKDWLSIKSMDYVAGVPSKLEKNPADTAVIVFTAAANAGDPRIGSIDISTTKASNGKENTSSMTVSISQAGVSGTLATPFTVSQAIEYCKTLTGPTSENFYVKGIVTKTLYTFSASYGNGTFWISDDGTDFVTENKKSTDDKNHDFECYSILWLGNTAWVDGEAQLAPGDEVVICGQLTNYNGLAETNSKKAYVYSVNGCTVAGAGAGNEEYPFSVAGAINALNGGMMNAAKDYFVQGIVTKTLYTFSADYGTGTFWISDDGTDSVTENKKGTNDKFHDFECYSVYWKEGKPWAEGDPQVAAGDKVVIKGQLTLYNGVSETNSKKAYVYSHTPTNA